MLPSFAVCMLSMFLFFSCSLAVSFTDQMMSLARLLSQYCHVTDS